MLISPSSNKKAIYTNFFAPLETTHGKLKGLCGAERNQSVLRKQSKCKQIKEGFWYFSNTRIKCVSIYLSQRAGYNRAGHLDVLHRKKDRVIIIPVLIEEGHDRHRVEQLSAHGPAGSVDAVLGYLDGCETLAGQRLQRSKHGAAHKRLAQLWLVHEWIVLKWWGGRGVRARNREAQSNLKKKPWWLKNSFHQLKEGWHL